MSIVGPIWCNSFGTYAKSKHYQDGWGEDPGRTVIFRTRTTFLIYWAYSELSKNHKSSSTFKEHRVFQLKKNWIKFLQIREMWQMLRHSKERGEEMFYNNWINRHNYINAVACNKLYITKNNINIQTLYPTWFDTYVQFYCAKDIMQCRRNNWPTIDSLL